MRNTPIPSEMPAPEDGRPLGGSLDDLDTLFDFWPVFERAVARVTSPDADTRRALHELVCILATRLHVERVVLLPLLPATAPEIDRHRHFKAVHHRIELLLAKIDRRHASDPDLPDLFAQLQAVVESSLTEQRTAAAAIQADLSEDAARDLRTSLHAAIDAAMTRPHPHLPHYGPAGRLANTVTARLDRVRNRAPVR